jgi:hypothetical protein
VYFFIIFVEIFIANQPVAKFYCLIPQYIAMLLDAVFVRESRGKNQITFSRVDAMTWYLFAEFESDV